MKRLGLLLLAVFVMCTAFFSVPATAFGATYTTVSGTFRYGDAQSVLKLVNKQRAANGLPALVMTQNLTDAAMKRAAECAVRWDPYEHIRPNGQDCWTAWVYSGYAAENIHKGSTTPSAAMDSWMNSSGHRKNILSSKAGFIGIGCFKYGSTFYWTQVFSDTTTSGTDTRSSTLSATVKVSKTGGVDSIVSTSPVSPSTKYCTIKFKANGGKGKMSNQKVKVGVKFTLKKNAFTRSGYVFRGWAESKSGSMVVGNKGTGTAGKEGTKTLYAKWAKKSYKVAFYANGGKGKMSKQKMTYGKSAKLRANKFTRKGYTFKGWAKSKKGKVVYKNKKSVKNLTTSGKTVKLYAKWKKKSSSAKYITAKFYPNGGTGSVITKKYKVGTVPHFPKNNTFTRSGYKFYAWYYPPDGVYCDEQSSINTSRVWAEGIKTMKFYAYWVKAKSKSPNTPAEASDAGATVSSLPEAAEPWVVATTSDGSDGTAVLDGDETTAWSPETADGSWVVLSFEDMLDVSDVEVLGENLPEGTRILFSQDADDWTEDLPCAARYVWVAFPEADLPPIVKEIRVEEE